MIAVDAMGGDFAPYSAVKAALNAAQKNIKVGLYGNQVQLFSLLYEYDINWQQLPIEVIHCSQVIEMTDQASTAVLRKKDASLVRALYDVKNGIAHAVVSAGNSGASLVGGSIILGKIDGIDRPAIGAFVPGINGRSTFCLDLGVTVDCKPDQLVQFAAMGHVYFQLMRNASSPRIGLLSNGKEPYKGSSLVQKAYALLHERRDINFVGNIEPLDLMQNAADVVVSDGFSGNILLKTVEALYGMHKNEHQLKEVSLWHRWLNFLSSSMRCMSASRSSYDIIGGALLLGVRYPLVITHGNVDEAALSQAIFFAHKKVKTGFIERFTRKVHEHMNKYDTKASSGARKKLHSPAKFDKSV